VIILDTNVLSALMRDVPDQRVVAWLDGQAATSTWITSVTVFEIRFGLALLPNGRRRRALEHAFEGLLSDDLGGRILSFDDEIVNLPLGRAELAATR
jgi:predicted nucleic acid-binding protein